MRIQDLFLELCYRWQTMSSLWTGNRDSVKNWQKERTRPNPDLTLQSAMDTKTDQFKQIAREAKQSKWKSFYEELNAEITLTQFWQFYQQLEGDARTKTIPDIKDTNKTKLKTNQEKGRADLGRFLQQSNQNKLEERKHIMRDLNRTLAQSGSAMTSRRRNPTKR